MIIELCFDKPKTEYEAISENCIKQPIDDDLMEMHYRNVNSRNIQKLLSLFTNYYFFDYSNFYQAWFSEFNGDRFSQKSIWGQQSYTVPSFNKKIKKLSEFKFEAKSNEIKKQKDLNKYYNQLSAGSRGMPFEFPFNIDVLFDEYSLLNGKKKEAFDSACILFYYGFDLLTVKKSLSLASFISSIETLIEYEYSDDPVTYKCDTCKSIEASPKKCPNCNEPFWGVRAKFREFLSRYGNSSKEFEKYASNFYTIRSKILHRGQLLLADKDINHWAYDARHESMTESLKVTYFMKATRICLINWLIKNNEKEKL